MTTAAQETVLRTALAMFASDPQSAATRAQRAWLVARLSAVGAAGREIPFLPSERAAVRAPLLAYIGAHHPRILAIVTAQCAPEESCV